MGLQLDESNLGSVSLDDLQDITARNYIRIASLTFLLYDHILTFHDEVELIWSSYMTKGSYLFLFLRYFAPLSTIVEAVIDEVKVTPEQCERYGTAHQLFLVVIQVGLCLVLTIRTYALYLRDKRILAVMITIGCLLIGISIWSLLGQKVEAAHPVVGCNIAISPETGAQLATSWEALLAYDSLLLVLTLWRSYQLRDREDSGALVTSSVPVVKLVARDGALYYVVMVAVNLANILTFHLAGPHFRGVLSTMASNMSVTMISHLFLRLRSSANRDLDGNVSTSFGQEFATIPVAVGRGGETVIELGDRTGRI